MYARVSRFESADAEAMRASAADITSRAPSGPPEGVPAKGFILLIDPEGGRGLAIGLFETEADLEAGDAVLNAMTPPSDGMGHRVSVERYEVAVDVRH